MDKTKEGKAVETDEHAQQVTRSYNMTDSSWNNEKIKGILNDASNLASKHDTSYCIGIDDNQNVVIFPNLKNSSMFVLVCGVTKRTKDNFAKDYLDSLDSSQIKEELEKEFWDNVAYRRYTINEMIPRVRDSLVNGIIEYGGIKFLSEGRHQLSGVLDDAKKMSEMYNKPFIAGLSKKRGIMIAPASEKSQFVTPLSCVITKSGFWNISSMCSHRVVHLGYIIDIKDVYEKSERYGVTDAMYELYYGIAYGRKKYGAFQHKYEIDMIHLVQAFEDAVKLLEWEGERDGQFDRRSKFCVGLNHDNGIEVMWRDKDAFDENFKTSFLVDYQQLCNKEGIDSKKIKTMADNVYKAITDSLKKSTN